MISQESTTKDVKLVGQISDNMTNIDIDNDVEIATEETIEEQEIVARYTAQSEILESEDEAEPEEPDPVPIPQNADMRKMLD